MERLLSTYENAENSSPRPQVSHTLLPRYPDTLGTSICTEHTHRLVGDTSLPRQSLPETLYERFSNAFI